MDGKGWLTIGGGVAALLALANPDKALEILGRLAQAVDEVERRRALQASPRPVLPPPPPPLLPPKLDFTKMFDNLGATPSGSPTTVPAYTPAVDEVLARLVDHPAIVLILGHRGSGKSALAVRLQELLRDAAPPYAIGLPSKPESTEGHGWTA